MTATASPPSTLLIAATNYAARGWPVFPLHGLRPSPNADGRLVCTCGNPDCRSPGKHAAPIAPNGPRDATTSLSRIARWWAKGAVWNIAIRTGRSSGLYVVDVPAGVDAPDGLPQTLAAVTGTGGHHLFYGYPAGRWPNTSNRLADGVLTRGEGGYLIVAPSMHHSGQPYTWVDHSTDVAELPTAILDRLQPATEAAAPVVDTSDFLAAVEGEIPSFAPELDESGDPFALFHSPPDNPARALRALADRLASAGVHPDTVVRAVVHANDEFCRGALSESDAVDVADCASAAEVARKIDEQRKASATGQIDEKTPAGQKMARTARARERAQKPSAYPALSAYLSTALSVIDYDDGSGELQVRWHDDRSTATLHPWADRDLPKEVGRHLGSLSSFAAKAHPDAKGKHVIDVLRDFARHAPARQTEAEDSEPVALVGAILASNTWRIGDNGKQFSVMVDALTGWVAEAGVGIEPDANGHRILFVSPDRLAGGELSKSAQFRGKTAAQIRKLLEAAPGYVGKRRARRSDGQLRVLAVDLTEFSRIMGRANPTRDEASASQVSIQENPRNAGTAGTGATVSREIDMFSAESECATSAGNAGTEVAQVAQPARPERDGAA